MTPEISVEPLKTEPQRSINGSGDYVIEEARFKADRPPNERASLGEFTK